MKPPILEHTANSPDYRVRWFVAVRLLVLLCVAGFLTSSAVVAAGFEQNGKGKKADGQNPKQGGPKAPVKSAPSPAPVTGRSYADIVAQSGPARRRAWAPRPVLGTDGRQVVGVVRGRVHTSSDSGATWTTRGNVGANGDEAVALGLIETGVWACVLRSGAVFESRDNGTSWTLIAELAQLSEIKGPRAVEVAVIGPSCAWAIVRGYSDPLPSSALIVWEANAWKLGTSIPGAAVAGWLSEQQFAAIVGSTVILGGRNGDSQARGATLSGASLNDIAFASASQAWIAADSGLVVESKDGGKTWLPRPVLAGQDLDVIGSVPGGITWVVGHAGPRGYLAVNREGRSDWKITLQAPAPLSRPVRANDVETLVIDWTGVVWVAQDPSGPWTKRGSLGVVPPK